MSIICVCITERDSPCNKSVSHVVGEELLQHPGRFLDHVRQSAKELIKSDFIGVTYLDCEGDACTLTEGTIEDALCFLKEGESGEHPQILELEAFAKEQTGNPQPCQGVNFPAAHEASPQTTPATSESCPWGHWDQHWGHHWGQHWGQHRTGVQTGHCPRRHGGHQQWGPHHRPWEHWAQRTAEFVNSFTLPSAHNTGMPQTHLGVVCDGCGQSPISGVRYRSLKKHNYDLCGACHDRADRDVAFGLEPNHKFEQVQQTWSPASMVEAWRLGKGVGKACGKGIDHHFESVFEDEGPFVFQDIPGLIAFLQDSGTNLSQLLSKIAIACCSTVQNLEEESLLPLLELLSPLTEQEMGADISAFAFRIKDMLEILQSADRKVQKKFCENFGMAIHTVLVEAGVDGNVISGPLMALGKGLGKGLAKGLGKGLAKGCKGAGKGKGLSWCIRKMVRGFMKQARSGAEADESSSDDAPLASSNVPNLSPDASMYERAFAALLSHPNEVVRSAAESALQQAQLQTNGEKEQPEHIVASEPGLVSVTSAAVLEVPVVEASSASLVFEPNLAGDVTAEWTPLLSQFPTMSQAYRFGRFSWSSANSDEHFAVVTVCARLINNGQQAWPESTTLRIAAGNAFGLEELVVGAVAPGQVAELEMNLAVPSKMEETRSAWSLEDHGQPFGPLMILEIS